MAATRARSAAPRGASIPPPSASHRLNKNIPQGHQHKNSHRNRNHRPMKPTNVALPPGSDKLLCLSSIFQSIATSTCDTQNTKCQAERASLQIAKRSHHDRSRALMLRDLPMNRFRRIFRIGLWHCKRCFPAF